MRIRARERIGPGLLVLLICVLVALALPASVIGRPRLTTTAGPTGVVCTEDPTVGSATFSLKTNDGFISVPDGNSLYMWGYTLSTSPFQMPGPVLCVEEDDIVTISLTNYLPEPSSIVFPGQAAVTATGGSPGLFTREASACTGGPPCTPGTVSYSFVASEPGTYLYESGTAPHKQVHMGLYGVLVVRPALNATNPGHYYAYNDEDTEYDPAQEFVLVLHETDPDLHYAVEQGLPYDVTTMHDRYWNINGRSMPDTVAANFAPWLPSQPYGALVQVKASPDGSALPALIRYANAGMFNHPFHPHGNNMRLIAHDGRLLEGPLGEDTSFENFTTTIGSGQTYDLLWRWINTDAWTPTGNPVPVVVPGLQNLVFKDDLTFYSGSPYLGYQGELPVGTTSYNQCGEFYFPWHSHALEEVQNFDEGFGGLMTVVRVDPPSGCP